MWFFIGKYGFLEEGVVVGLKLFFLENILFKFFFWIDLLESFFLVFVWFFNELFILLKKLGVNEVDILCVVKIFCILLF